MRNELIIIILFVITSTYIYSKNCIENSQKLFNSGKYKESINLIEDCLTDALDSKDNNLVSELYYGLGINYYKLGELDSALKNYLISEFTLQKVNNPKLKAILNNEIAILYIDKGMNHKAIYYIKKSLELNKSLNRTKGIARNYINLGNTFTNLSMLDSSLYYFKNSLNLLNSESELKSITYNNISFVYEKMGDIKKSLSNLSKALEGKEIGQLERLLYQSNYDFVLMMNGSEPKYKVKNEYLKQSSISSNVEYADANFKASLYEIHKRNFKSAMNYLNEANKLYLSINNLNKATEITKDFIDLASKENGFNLSMIFKTYKNFEEKERVQYSNLLLKEMDLRIETEKSIIDLNERLTSAKLNINLLIAFIVCLVLLIPITIRYLIVNNLHSRIKNYQMHLRNELIELHENGIKNNLGKIISLMVISKRFNDDDIFVEIIEDIVKDSNKLSRVINNNKLIGLKDANTITTNELPMGK